MSLRAASLGDPPGWGKKIVTGKKMSSQPLNLLSITSKKSKKLKICFKWKIGLINVQSGSDDFRVNLILQQCMNADIDADWM